MIYQLVARMKHVYYSTTFNFVEVGMDNKYMLGGGLLMAIVLLSILAVLTVVGLAKYSPSSLQAGILAISFIPTTVLSLLSLLKSAQNGEAIKEVHVMINSRLTELLEKTAQNATLVERHANESPRKVAFENEVQSHL
jgi:hypothetical protein